MRISHHCLATLLVVVVAVDLALFGLTFGLPFGLPLGCRSITLIQQKLESGSDDSRCVLRIKVCSIPQIFVYCVETKEYCEQNETLDFFPKMRLFGEFLVNESRVVVSFLFQDKDSIDWFSLVLFYK